MHKLSQMDCFLFQNTITNAEKLLAAADELAQTGECDQMLNLFYRQCVYFLKWIVFYFRIPLQMLKSCSLPPMNLHKLENVTKC